MSCYHKDGARLPTSLFTLRSNVELARGGRDDGNTTSRLAFDFSSRAHLRRSEVRLRCHLSQFLRVKWSHGMPTEVAHSEDWLGDA